MTALKGVLLTAALLLAAMAPSASAADFFWVNAAATSTPAAGGQVLLTVGCQTSDPSAQIFYLYKCEVGPVRADTYCGFECFGPPVAGATGLAPAGSYELCVGAASIGTLSKNFHKCVPLDPLTGTAVIRR